MTIAPIVKTVDVKCPPARAFALFTGRMAGWWPASHHIGGAPFEEIVIEPKVGGRWFERGEGGAETEWGKVLAWSPPDRVVLAWQLKADFTYDPAFETEVEITFEAHGAGARVRLEHRNLERYGADAEKIAVTLGGGWPTIVELFAAFADQPVEEGV
jgi:uncharacterized protein YndB with AHSA1/START domain